MQSSPTPFDIRWLCAVLRRIDDDVLAALAHANLAAAAELLGDALECLDGAYWRVRAEHAQHLLLELQRSAPTHEVDLHHQAFCYYLERLRRPESARPGDYDDCLHHLDRLFMLVGGQIDWQTIARYAADVRTAPAIEVHHLQRLDLYEGYSAIRLQQYSSGEARLLPLADDETAAPDVRTRALKGLADGAYMRSQYEVALERYERLLEVAASSGDETYQGLALLNMGLVLHELDRNDEALAFCERSMALFQRTGDRVREAHARYHTALYSMYLGRWQEAATHAGLVAPLFEHLGLTSFLGYVYWLRGYLSHMLGDEAASDAYYQRALPLAETQLGHLSLAMDIWLYRGFLFQTQERAEQALECYQHALEAAQRLERPHALCVIYFRIGQTLQHAGRRHEALAAFETAVEYVEQLQGAMVVEDVKIKLLGTTQQIYEAAVLLLLDLGRGEEAFQYVERACSRAFLDTLARRSPELYATFDAPVATLAEVQGQLPERAVLLEYYTTGVLPRGEHALNRVPAEHQRLRSHLVQPAECVVFVISRDHLEWQRLQLDPNRVRPMIGDRHPGRHLLLGRLPRALYDRLIGPVAHALAHQDVVYLVPHGPLHYVPFSALCDEHNQPLLRRDGPAIASAPSATILCRNCLAERPRASGKALVIGHNSQHGERPLVYAEAEARHVARLLDGQALVGSQPKRAFLYQHGPQARLIHIAGHARFEPDSPLDSALTLGDDEELSARAIVSDLELGAELVTLSSCMSGVSHVVPGDELLGLQRALFYAGAATIVCTRWEATDLVALLVMDRFYTALNAGASPAAALCQAQVAVRELTVSELQTLVNRWAHSGTALADLQPRFLEALAAVRAEASQQDTPSMFAGHTADDSLQPFADPLLWAPFMVVGRA